MALIFDEKSMIDNSVFKFEKRLQSPALKSLNSLGAVLVTYFNISDETTVDRGLQDIDHMFGKKSPMRWNKIKNLPLYEPGSPVGVNNTDEQQIEDITSEGDFLIQPNTVIPRINDFFIINHIKMRAIFQVKEVAYDGLKQHGLYKISYRLFSTSEETIASLEQQCVAVYDTDLAYIGTNVAPVIKEEFYIKRKQLNQMINKMIESYKALFYNQRHNCFLYYDQQHGYYLFDMCGNEFMAKHSLMNNGSNSVVVLNTKINDKQLPVLYNHSIFNWMEVDAPKQLLQPFYYILSDADGYYDSSFARWNETDIKVIWPLHQKQAKCHFQEHCYFSHETLEVFRKGNGCSNAVESILCKYINDPHHISMDDIPLTLINSLLSSERNLDIYLFTPILIFLIRKLIKMN